MSDESTVSSSTQTWSEYAKQYDPIKIGSIDGTDTEPHDRAVVRALNSEYRANRHVKGRPECTIFVARLSPKTTKDTIKDVFSKYGRLRRFRLVKDIVTGLPKGYAFIEYETEHAAEDAYKKANKMRLDGQAIFVDFECERLLKDWKPRRLGGGFGGRKESGQLRFGGRDRPFRKPISLEIQERQQLDKEQSSQDYRAERRYSDRRRYVDDRTDRRKRSREREKSKENNRQVKNKNERCRSPERNQHKDKRLKKDDLQSLKSEENDNLKTNDDLKPTNRQTRQE